MFDSTTELPDPEVNVSLRVRNHESVKALREELGQKREALEELRRERREVDARRSELEERFDEALQPDSDLDPSEVREERLQLEDRYDRFQERRTRLKAEISSLEQRIHETAEEAREEITEEVSEPLRQLHEAYAHHLEQAIKAHLKLKEFDALGRGHQYVGNQPVQRPELPVDDPQFDFPGLVGAYKQLKALSHDGFDIDEDLLTRLRKDLHV